MLPKEHRLSTKFQFNIVRKYGASIKTPYFYINYLKPKNYIGPTKVGFIVSNKLSKSATKRNKVKRQLREIIRKNMAKIANDLWISISPKATIFERKYEELSTEFDKALQKISVTR